MYCIASCGIILAAMCLGQVEADRGQAVPDRTEQVNIQLRPDPLCPPPPPVPVYVVRITPQDLIALVQAKPPSAQLQIESQRQATIAALEKISMPALLDELGAFLTANFGHRFSPDQDLIRIPVPADRQVDIDTPDLDPKVYHGPTREVIGFLIHDLTEAEFNNVAVLFIQTARKLLDSGNPAFDRSSADYFRLLAKREVADLRDAIALDLETARRQAEIRARVAEALGLTKDPDGHYVGDAKWLKESRRFSYIITEGKFIQRLEPLVAVINEEMAVAGFAPPLALDQPGITYDPEIGDVEIVLPKTMLDSFLSYADGFERRMAEDAVISIEVVRLTDRDLISGALASRLNAQIQGVHDPSSGFSRGRVFRELGINALLAVANQTLQVQTLEGIAAGNLPAGIQAVQIAPPALPPIVIAPQRTTIGSTFSIGADPLFFDGRQQVYGFSYLGPDGVSHSLTLEVVDSLRQSWERIERNLIVHKIKKTDTTTTFSVPVGPDTKTYDGIAALISQENQQLIVATGTGAISEISATAGTWLVIKDFEIAPIPGSSTTLTEEEQEAIEAKVLLTMFLRDPNTDSDIKRSLLETKTTAELRSALLAQLDRKRDDPIRTGRQRRTYGTIFDERHALTLADERLEKKEKNSVITLTFFSSQGNIVQSPGTTQLGDANDLTSFTTLLRPNVVTPISSFFTKAGSGTTGSSLLTGADKGEQTDQNKVMTHLVIRARFPTIGREQADRDEGRFTGYFELPIKRLPSSFVDLPFLSSSEHPAERLAKLRIGLMFPVLDYQRVRLPFAGFNPQRFPGDVPREAWETATSRMLLIRKIIGDSPGACDMLASDYIQRFIIEVRSLLEYDEDFFDAPSVAMRNLTHWNQTSRIVLALNNSPGRFALHRLVQILDELGSKLVPDAYAEDCLAVCPPAGWSARRIHPLSDQELRCLRRDVAVHYLRFREAYGDAFLEAAARLLRLGTYLTKETDELMEGPFRGYRDLVVFDQGGTSISNPAIYDEAHQAFLFLKSGGYKGKLFERSMLTLEHLPEKQRRLIYRGRDILVQIEKDNQERDYR
ncbi:MAG: hypothetical protein IID40_04015 [Planctomycetes bacterium]|nr:hypothetical protein [Planctomycetota bacterium]